VRIISAACSRRARAADEMGWPDAEVVFARDQPDSRAEDVFIGANSPGKLGNLQAALSQLGFEDGARFVQ